MVVAMALTTAAPGGEAQPSAEDRLLEQRLEWFRDQKFGLFLHWGIYSQLGCIESWQIGRASCRVRV